MSLTGADPGHPQRVGVPVGDLTAGIYGAYGVLAALRERDRTGRGPVGRTSLLAALVQIACGNQAIWQRLCAQFGLDPDDADYATNTSRLEHVDALTARLERCFGGELSESTRHEHGAPPVLDADGAAIRSWLR